MVFKLLERRDQKIRDQIDELDSEEEYLERIHRDHQKLDRSTYTAILMAMCLCFVSLALLTGAFAFDLSPMTMKYVYLLSSWMFLVAAGMCFYHFRSIMRIGDFDRTRQTFRDKKSWLEDRLK